MGKILLVIMAICLLIGSIAVTAHQNNECKKDGGTLVRGIFWFECIHGER